LTAGARSRAPRHAGPLSRPGRPSPSDGLRRLLAPRSIAVVGASDRPGSYGADALRNLSLLGFPGPVWGVNPGRREALGRPCWPSVADLPEPVDAVVVAIPAAGVPDVIEQAGARGCGGAVVFSAGFAEVAAGRELQAQLVDSARRHGLALCGPNCNGIVVPSRRVALWGDALGPLAHDPSQPSVALISQSGNVAVNALASVRGLAFHTVIASGNQAVLGASDYLRALVADGPETAPFNELPDAIALYLEDDGGPELVDALALAVDARVPVVVLKVGRSRAGARAAAAHSGALAGDQRVFHALAQEAGAAWADDVHELLELAGALAVRRRSTPARSHAHARAAREGAGRGVAIMTCSGGDSAQAADEAERLGLSLAELAPATLSRLGELLPPAATAANPLDYTSMLWGEVDVLSELVRALGADADVDQVLVCFDQPPRLDGAQADSWSRSLAGIARGAARSPAPVLVCSTLPELLDDAAARELHRRGIATAAGLRTGLRCLAAIAQHTVDAHADVVARAARLREIAAVAQRAGPAGGRGRTRPGGPACPGDGDERGWLAEHEAKELLAAAGVPVPSGRTVRDRDDAVRAWRELGGPLALKLSARSVRHKSELGGVALGLDCEPGVRAAFDRLRHLAGVHGGEVLAERTAPAGVELLVAAHRDGVVPALVLGLGGVLAEVLDDVAVVALPARESQIRRALADLRAAPLLLGARGGAGVDVGAVAAIGRLLGELLLERDLRVVECNPVIAWAPGAGAQAVDATIREGTADG